MAEIHITQTLAAHWPVVAFGVTVVYLVSIYFNRGLNRYPGPFLAKFTDAWRMWDVLNNHHNDTLIKLHKKYGPVVRIGPNTVEVADPSLVPTVYGVHKGFVKSSFYLPFRTYSNGEIISTLFAFTDEQVHAATKRPVAGMYSLSGLTDYEPLVDDMIKDFVERIAEEFDGPTTRGRPCDMAQWLHYMAFDLILNLTFGETMGFLRKGGDVDNFIGLQNKNLDSASVTSQMPWTRLIHRHNPLRRIFKLDSNVAAPFVREQLTKHLAKIQGAKAHEYSSSDDDSDSFEKESGKTTVPGSYGDDFLTRFLLHPRISTTDAVRHCMSNVAAGSDTTAITLRACVYYILKSPSVKARLVDEIRTAEPPLSSTITWKESQRLPYLNAVVQEAIRLHPAVGLSLERVVPPTGLELPDGTRLPGGTCIGMNPWVIQRNEEIYGPLPTDEFHPERWLQGENETAAEFEARRAAMRRVELTFGHNGSKRVCIGRNIAFLEIYKLIPTLFRDFEIELANPNQEWTTRNRMFVHQTDMDCILKRREETLAN